MTVARRLKQQLKRDFVAGLQKSNSATECKKPRTSWLFYLVLCDTYVLQIDDRLDAFPAIDIHLESDGATGRGC